MPVRYGWRPGSHISLDPQRAGEELDRLRTRHNGQLTPETVVAQARDPKSSLHPHFEWDDSAAAEKWRESQAGQLIRSLTVDITRSNIAEPRHIRAFVNVERDNDRHYVSVAHAMSDADLRRQVLQRAFAELEAWRARHAELTELARIFAAIDETRSAIEGA
ncbi:MAG TPA: hypothetical protein VEA41_23880 [Salinarimonas sp.]|nr:hypothetical protein [Salinarimonas sp.]